MSDCVDETPDYVEKTFFFFKTQLNLSIFQIFKTLYRPCAQFHPNSVCFFQENISCYSVNMSFFFLSSFLIAHSFGRRMLYPGSVGLLQKAMRPMLQQGQARLIEEVKETHTLTH